MILGLRSAIYLVPDLAKAREWYAEVLGKPPYFDQPGYVGFDAGGYELGLFPQQNYQAQSGYDGFDSGKPAQADNAKEGGNCKPPSVMTYWGVEDIEKAHERLLSLGARPAEKITDVGGGIKIAAVLDPFGNTFGIIQNPNFRAK
ncbi:MAG: VOC family protein [Gammaproteobacteria bacterium]